MAADAYFITGTDTGVGKTWTCLALMHLFKQRGRRVLGMKPVASGCQWRQGQWQNEDALLIQKHASIKLSYQQVNPYAYEMPVAPVFASGGEQIDDQIINSILTSIKQQADIVLVEGAGGWFSPLSGDLTNAGLAMRLNLSVIVVVGIRLGCMNQALLTFDAIKGSGLNCAGWIATQLRPDLPFGDESIDYLQERLAAPLIGVLPYCERADYDLFAAHLSPF